MVIIYVKVKNMLNYQVAGGKLDELDQKHVLKLLKYVKRDKRDDPKFSGKILRNLKKRRHEKRGNNV